MERCVENVPSKFYKVGNSFAHLEITEIVYSSRTFELFLIDVEESRHARAALLVHVYARGN